MSVPWYLMAKGKGGGGYKTASGPIVSISDALAAPLRSLLVGIDPVQEGTGDPSPDNVRPISGWSEANLWRTGKNLIGTPYYSSSTTFEDGFKYTVNADGSITADGTATSTRYFEFSSQTILQLLKAGSYIVHKTGSSDISFNVWTPGRAIAAATTTDKTFTLTTDTLVYCYLRVGSGVTLDNVTIFPEIEVGSIATPYEPPSGNQYTIQLGQTVYGGTLDVLGGVLTVDRANIASYNGEALPGEWISDRDVYAPGTTPTIGAQVVYPLATPITIPLTPTEISTLKGKNNLWADTGDVTVEYLSAGGANPDLMKLAVAFMGRK